MKKIAILFGTFNLSSRPLDFHFNNIFESSRGATGSDLSTCMISKELAKLGNDVHIFTVHAEHHNRPTTWEGCKLYSIEERFTIIDNTFDLIISINDPMDLKDLKTNAKKIFWQFLNDHTYVSDPNFEDYFDIALSPCEMHMEHIKKQVKKPEKWSVMPLGCDPSWYEENKKVKNRMIFCSSPDRGLAWALQCYPAIKKAVPDASLRIFYHMQEGSILNIEHNDTTNHPHVIELSNRLRYCKSAISKMKHLDVEHVGSVSVNQMKKEMSEAELLLFPVDTVAFSEGFSLSILQAHAAGVMPAITSADCLGSIYRDSGCIMVDMPIKDKLNEYTELVIKALTDQAYADDIREKCKEFSKQYLWSDIAKQIEKLATPNTCIINVNNNPSISIIMPTMRPGGFDILFKSLENQTFKDFELIIVDGIYKYRKDIIAEQIKKYNFTVKHVEPIKNDFPISCLAHTTNTGIVHASAPLILMITDYTYLPPDCVAKHVAFHQANPAENAGYMCPHQYRSLPELNPSFPTYQNEDVEKYLEDINANKLDNVFWSIFKEDFNQDPESLSLDSMGNADTKLFMAYGPGDQNAFNAKNESLKLEAALKVNGWDEELDGAHLCQDNVFSDILVRKLGFVWTVDKDNKAYIINPRFVMPHARRIRHHLTNYPIWERKKANNFSEPVNDWNLRDKRNEILNLSKPIIKLNLGSGKSGFSSLASFTQDFTGWKNIDIYPEYDTRNGTFECYDMTLGIKEKDNSVDQIFMSEILEHLVRLKAKFVLQECFRVLKSDGKILITVPDMEAAMPKWLSAKTEEERYQISRLIWGEQDDTYQKNVIPDSHFNGFTEGSLTNLLDSLGFTKIKRVNYVHNNVWFELEIEAYK